MSISNDMDTDRVFDYLYSAAKKKSKETGDSVVDSSLAEDIRQVLKRETAKQVRLAGSISELKK